MKSKTLNGLYRFPVVLLSFFALSGCQPEDVVPDDTNEPDALDAALEEALLNSSNGVGKDHYRFPTSLDGIPQDPNNPLTEAKVALGKLLFHETGLAVHPKHEEGRFTYSCSSCHHVDGGFQACLPQGLGEGGSGFGLHGEGRYPNSSYNITEVDLQPIRTPSALNIAYQTNILWNGQFGGTHLNVGTESSWGAATPKAWNFLGYEGTETQAIAGLHVHRMDMTAALFNSGYQSLYEAAFGNLSSDTVMSNVYVGLAIAAYERTLLATEAPFQKWLNGQSNALTAKQKQGAILFFGKAECYTCHNGPALNSMDFFALGMKDLDGPGVYLVNDPTVKLGRGGFTGNSEDDYKFKVPQLYNLINSRFYGHGASFHSVEKVIRYKNNATPENLGVPSGQLAADFHPLYLSNSEIEAITDFIERGLYDANLQRYVPASIPSGNCFPNNDPRSSQDMGCN